MQVYCFVLIAALQALGYLMPQCLCRSEIACYLVLRGLNRTLNVRWHRKCRAQLAARRRNLQLPNGTRMRGGGRQLRFVRQRRGVRR
ncbi:hypothetical protein BJ741DRAFT_590169 [Chytriomyces cf. hyalinus JEL632]|nr:hypothetical protein BJ741DRAFT_590169 [Chytriomyces cf. hyalinus JEL632]